MILVTNATGGLNKDFKVGDIMVISDHISIPGISGQNPLIGLNVDEFGVRFPPMSDAYDFDLRVLAFRAARDIGLDDSDMKEGIYGHVAGPSYEARAEARFLRDNGADVVGMSTIPEIVVARHAGMRILGISLITNKVAVGYPKSAKDHVMKPGSPVRKKFRGEINDDQIVATHNEVLENSDKKSKDVERLVKRILEMYEP
jgi:purine-nucleoside phosphorylase